MNADLKKHLEAHLSWAPPGEDRLRFLVLALAGEVGELADTVKKDWRGDAGDRSAAIVSELADTDKS